MHILEFNLFTILYLLLQILNEWIDNTVSIDDTTQNKLCKCIDLQKFIKTHCVSCEYSFQVILLHLFILHIILEKF